jgi:hypothetical protein
MVVLLLLRNFVLGCGATASGEAAKQQQRIFLRD